jgi:hypothetical protein
VYDLQETEAGDIAARLVRHSPYSFEDTMNLNLYEDHVSYVSDMEKYSHSYLCPKCDRLWKHVGRCNQPSCDVTGFCVLQVIHMTEGYTPPPPPPLTEGYTPPPPPLIEGYTPQQQQYSQSIVTLLYFENQ